MKDDAGRVEMNGKTLAITVFCWILFTGGSPELPPVRAHAEAIAIQPVTYSQWQDRLAGYRGKIVVVDYWATWCAPCVERFPHMVELNRKYAPTGKVRFVSMSLDDRDDPTALKRAREFLVSQEAVFDNYLMDEIVPDAFEKLDLLGIPAVHIYDETGKLRHRLTGDNPNKQFTDSDVEAAIRELLKGFRGPSVR